MAIDPQYVERTEIDTDELDEDDPEFTPKRPYVSTGERFDEDEEDTAKRRQNVDPEDEATRERVGDLVAEAQRRKAQSEPSTPPVMSGATPGMVPGLAAFRVAVLPIPEERDVRLIFISPGQEPPPGVATALLVPPSPEDARLISEIYNDTDAKL